MPNNITSCYRNISRQITNFLTVSSWNMLIASYCCTIAHEKQYQTYCIAWCKGLQILYIFIRFWASDNSPSFHEYLSYCVCNFCDYDVRKIQCYAFFFNQHIIFNEKPINQNVLSCLVLYSKCHLIHTYMNSNFCVKYVS